MSDPLRSNRWLDACIDPRFMRLWMLLAVIAACGGKIEEERVGVSAQEEFVEALPAHALPDAAAD